MFRYVFLFSTHPRHLVEKIYFSKVISSSSPRHPRPFVCQDLCSQVSPAKESKDGQPNLLHLWHLSKSLETANNSVLGTPDDIFTEDVTSQYSRVNSMTFHKIIYDFQVTFSSQKLSFYKFLARFIVTKGHQSSVIMHWQNLIYLILLNSWFYYPRFSQS